MVVAKGRAGGRHDIGNSRPIGLGRRADHRARAARGQQATDVVVRRIGVGHGSGAAVKRDGGHPITLDNEIADGRTVGSRGIDLLALDAALVRLGELDPRTARVVELRFFGGLSVDETAAALSISPASALSRIPCALHLPCRFQCVYSLH